MLDPLFPSASMVYTFLGRIKPSLTIIAVDGEWFPASFKHCIDTRRGLLPSYKCKTGAIAWADGLFIPPKWVFVARSFGFPLAMVKGSLLFVGVAGGRHWHVGAATSEGAKMH